MTPAEQDQLDAYLAGTLDAAEIEAFEILLLQRPDLAEQVDADTLLGMAFKEYARHLPGEAIVAAPEPAASLTARQTRRRWLPMALAASMALIIGLVAGRQWASPAGPAAGGASVAYVDQLRSSGTVAEVALPEAGSLILMAPIASPEPCLATLTLALEGSQIARAQSQSDALGYAGLRIDAGAVHEGSAELGVACAGGTPMVYPVTLRRGVAVHRATTRDALHQS